MKKLVISALAAAAAFGFAPAATAQAGDQFLGQLKSFGFDFCPQGWARADGALYPVAQNTALFSLLGTQFGGDGRNTYAVPNLNQRMAMGPGRGPGLPARIIGQTLGTQTVTLTSANLPRHDHRFMASANSQAQNTPENGSFPTYGAAVQAYAAQGSSDVSMNSPTIANAGGSQPLNIQQPVLAMTWCIATVGIYPSRS
jgi:microcystin-dependent protein